MVPTRRVIHGARLREIRQDTGPRLGLAEFAEEIGASPSFLSRLERGQRQPSHRMFRTIVEALDALGYMPAGAALDAISVRVPDERVGEKAA